MNHRHGSHTNRPAYRLRNTLDTGGFLCPEKTHRHTVHKSYNFLSNHSALRTLRAGDACVSCHGRASVRCCLSLSFFDCHLPHLCDVAFIPSRGSSYSVSSSTQKHPIGKRPDHLFTVSPTTIFAGGILMTCACLQFRHCLLCLASARWVRVDPENIFFIFSATFFAANICAFVALFASSEMIILDCISRSFFLCALSAFRKPMQPAFPFLDQSFSLSTTSPMS